MAKEHSASMNAIHAPPSNLTEAWWKWAVHLPSDPDTTDNHYINPFQDQSGDAARAGDVGHGLFFLAGFAGSSESTDPDLLAVERAFVVPHGATLVVPILNTVESVPDWNYYSENVYPNIGPASKGRVEQYIDDWKNEYAQSVFLEVDGKQVDVSRLYVKTDFFSLGSVEQGDLGVDVFGLQPEDVKQQPAMAGGYWAVLKNLGIGSHTLRFGGSLDFWNAAKETFGSDGIIDFRIEITDTIEVAPPKEYRAFDAPTQSSDDLILA